MPAAQIIEKIYAGELDGKGEVQLMGSGAFRKLVEVEAFRVHLAKADVKRKVDKVADAQASDRARGRNIRLVITAVMLVIIAGGVVVGGKYFAEHTPGKTSDELLADFITVDAPTVTRARAGGSEELFDYPGPNSPGTAHPNRPPTEARRDPVAPRPHNPAEPKPKPGEEDPDGMGIAAGDQDGIKSIFTSHQKSLFPCFKAVAKPGQLVVVPLEFTVAAGKVSKLWIDNPDLKNDQPLTECLMGELHRFPFKEGQTGSLKTSFNIGKKT